MSWGKKPENQNQNQNNNNKHTKNKNKKQQASKVIGLKTIIVALSIFPSSDSM